MRPYYFIHFDFTFGAPATPLRSPLWPARGIGMRRCVYLVQLIKQKTGFRGRFATVIETRKKRLNRQGSTISSIASRSRGSPALNTPLGLGILLETVFCYFNTLFYGSGEKMSKNLLKIKDKINCRAANRIEM